jgi:hypothetical protein
MWRERSATTLPAPLRTPPPPIAPPCTPPPPTHAPSRPTHAPTFERYSLTNNGVRSQLSAFFCCCKGSGGGLSASAAARERAGRNDELRLTSQSGSSTILFDGELDNVVADGGGGGGGGGGGAGSTGGADGLSDLRVPLASADHNSGGFSGLSSGSRPNSTGNQTIQGEIN